MFRTSIKIRNLQQKCRGRHLSSSVYIRDTFVKYFITNHGHKYIKSSSVVPLCDPSVPFVNAGMNQFKAVFLGNVDAPCARAVNSQKCIRVGGKHNDLDVVGVDGHHHTFFEMLGNWSFGDYYKKEACQMAWDLLLGPYRLKPDNLMVTYFSGDKIIGLQEDKECRDIWKSIGVQSSKIKGLGATDNFWEMGSTGPCGPCTEIHYINPDGSLTEIWNLVFIQFNREADGSVVPLRRHHVDTGMGLERMAALLQNVPSNYDTDLFQPIIQSIYKNSKEVSAYGGQFSELAVLDLAYRRLADHARTISVALADSVYPAASLNLKQLMRKSFKISIDVFRNEKLLSLLYDEVAASLGTAYPELMLKEKESKLIIDHELDAYVRMRANLSKKWKDLVKSYPEADALCDIDMAGFPLGYKEFKEVMSKTKSTVVPAELVFKLYDTYGFQEDLIERLAILNDMSIDRDGFSKLLAQHRARHKTSFKERASNRGLLFDEAISKLLKNGYKSTNDQYKYDYAIKDSKLNHRPLKTELVGILDENCEMFDTIEVRENNPYYLITKDTNFYCEEGGQTADTGIIEFNDNLKFKVESVFKVRDFVFHKGCFNIKDKSVNNCLKCKSNVVLYVDSVKRLNTMRNHTGVHLLNAAIREVLPNSVVCAIGSHVSDKGLSLSLSVYGAKLAQDVIMQAQDLIRNSIKSGSQLITRIVDSIQLSKEESLVTVPGETYPETGLRLVEIGSPLPSKELCCGTHLPSTGFVEEFLVTLVKGAGGNTPSIHAVTGDTAKKALELFSRAHHLDQVAHITDPDRMKDEANNIRQQLSAICGGSGAPAGEYAKCLALLEAAQKRTVKTDMTLHKMVETEMIAALEDGDSSDRQFVVHFLRCSYLMQGGEVLVALRRLQTLPRPTLLLGCAGGVIAAAAAVPKEMVTESFTAERWLRCVVPIFQADVVGTEDQIVTYAEMTPTKASLITCEQLVQDAMRVAIKFAQSHLVQYNTHSRGGATN